MTLIYSLHILACPSNEVKHAAMYTCTTHFFRMLLPLEEVRLGLFRVLLRDSIHDVTPRDSSRVDPDPAVEIRSAAGSLLLSMLLFVVQSIAVRRKSPGWGTQDVELVPIRFWLERKRDRDKTRDKRVRQETKKMVKKMVSR